MQDSIFFSSDHVSIVVESMTIFTILLCFQSSFQALDVLMIKVKRYLLNLQLNTSAIIDTEGCSKLQFNSLKKNKHSMGDFAH